MMTTLLARIWRPNTSMTDLQQLCDQLLQSTRKVTKMWDCACVYIFLLVTWNFSPKLSDLVMKSNGMLDSEIFKPHPADVVWHNQQTGLLRPVQVNMMLVERPIPTYSFSRREKDAMDYGDSMDENNSADYGEKDTVSAPDVQCDEEMRAGQPGCSMAGIENGDYDQVRKTHFLEFPVAESCSSSSSAHNSSKPEPGAFFDGSVVLGELPPYFLDEPITTAAVELPETDEPEAMMQINEDKFSTPKHDLNDFSSNSVNQDYENSDTVFDTFKNLENEPFHPKSQKSAASSPSSDYFSNDSHSSDSTSPKSRFYGKLCPEERDINFGAVVDEKNKKRQSRRVKKSPSPQKSSRRPGRASQDDALVRRHNLPASAEELVQMTHRELQRLLVDPSFSDVQRALMKKIRRRGRNKEAARKCRLRRNSLTRQISDSS